MVQSVFARRNCLCFGRSFAYQNLIKLINLSLLGTSYVIARGENLAVIDPMISRLFVLSLLLVFYFPLYFFRIFSSTNKLCLLLSYFDSVSLGRLDFFFLSCPLCFSPYSRLSSFRLLSLCVISFLLFPCASVQENTCTWVPHFLEPYRMVLVFFRQCNYMCTMCIRSEKVEVLVH